MKKDPIAYIALAAICLIWGTTYLALRIGVTHFPPFLFIGIRQTTAGLLLAGFLLISGNSVWPNKNHLLRQAIGGFFMITLGNGLVAWAEVTIPSGVAAIICTLMPMWVILTNLVINSEEKITVPIAIGSILGLGGVLMIFSEFIADLANPLYRVGIFLTFLATVSWATCSVWMKKSNTNNDPFLNAGMQMFFGGIFSFVISMGVDDLSHVSWSAEAGYSLLYLTIFGSLIAYACYTYALRKLPMTIVSLYAYINPIVAVFLGWMILNEKLNTKIWLAILITILGVYIVNRGYQFVAKWKVRLSKS
jgi:drug/metabolite transporter (DMT)-like permease